MDYFYKKYNGYKPLQELQTENHDEKSWYYYDTKIKIIDKNSMQVDKGLIDIIRNLENKIKNNCGVIRNNSYSSRNLVFESIIINDDILKVDVSSIFEKCDKYMCRIIFNYIYAFRQLIQGNRDKYYLLVHIKFISPHSITYQESDKIEFDI